MAAARHLLLRAAAEARIAQARLLPGFRDEPDCFEVIPADVDHDTWTDGYSPTTTAPGRTRDGRPHALPAGAPAPLRPPEHDPFEDGEPLFWSDSEEDHKTLGLYSTRRRPSGGSSGPARCPDSGQPRRVRDPPVRPGRAPLDPVATEPDGALTHRQGRSARPGPVERPFGRESLLAEPGAGTVRWRGRGGGHHGVASRAGGGWGR
ncbi:hypothetical protein GCM10020229_28430 [Kitasatospora albolonga]